jgi:hypothetical protein
MVDTSGLQKKLQDSEEKSEKFETKKRSAFKDARWYGFLGGIILALDLLILYVHDEDAYLQVQADYESGQLLIPDEYLQEKADDCIEEIYEDKFEEDQGVDFDDLDTDQLSDFVGKNREAFNQCSRDVLAQNSDVQEDYVYEQGFNWNGALFVWGGVAGVYALSGLNSWNRQRKYGNDAKSKAQELKLFD